MEIIVSGCNWKLILSTNSLTVRMFCLVIANLFDYYSNIPLQYLFPNLWLSIQLYYWFENIKLVLVMTKHNFSRSFNLILLFINDLVCPCSQRFCLKYPWWTSFCVVLLLQTFTTGNPFLCSIVACTALRKISSRSSLYSQFICFKSFKKCNELIYIFV